MYVIHPNIPQVVSHSLQIAAQLREGAQLDEMLEAFSSLQRGVESVQNGIKTIQTEIEPMRKGIDSIREGIAPMQQGIETIQHGIEPMRQAINEIQEGVGNVLLQSAVNSV
jgi:uncharacterized phage infection (PIP) family protein YhgE